MRTSKIPPFLILFVVLITTTTTLGQTIRYVDDDAALGGDGTSWTTAFKYLQDVLWIANAGDEIRVAGGTYKPDQDEVGNVTTGDRTATFQLISGVGLSGGYAGLTDPNNPNTRDIELYETILSGDLFGDDYGFSNYEENSYHVVAASDTGSTTVLNGFTITRGYANGSCFPDSCGAGIFMLSGNPTLANCHVTRNWVKWIEPCGTQTPSAGAGIYCGSSSSPTIDACVITYNIVQRFCDQYEECEGDAYGGGICCVESSHALIINCILSNNKAVHYMFATFDGWACGGGIYCADSSPTITHCTIEGNEVGHSYDTYACGGGIACDDNSDPVIYACDIRGNWGGYGAGVYAADSAPLVSHCDISGNHGDQGGGVYCTRADALIVDCTITGNVAHGMWDLYTGHGGALYFEDTTNPKVVNCTITGNTATGSGFGTSCGGGALFAGDASLANCILWGNAPEEICVWSGTPMITYSLVSGASGESWFGTGCIDEDPLFVNPIGGNYRLAPGSPCIDAGDNDAVPPDEFDLDGDGDANEPLPYDLAGDPRFINDPATDDTGNGMAPIVDMGAYEYQMEPDQLHIVGPLPSQVPIGGTGIIDATVQWQFNGLPDWEVIFTKLVGSFTFSAGTVSPDGTQASVVTDVNGEAQMTFVADDAGDGLIGVTVTDGALPMAFSVFEIVSLPSPAERINTIDGPLSMEERP